MIKPPCVKHKWVPLPREARNNLALSLTSAHDSPPSALKAGSANLAFWLGGRLSKCRPSCIPKFSSLSYSSLFISSWKANAKNAVSTERSRSELWHEVTCMSLSYSESLNAYLRPKSESGTSIHPVIVPAKLPCDSQLRTSITLRGLGKLINLWRWA